MFDRGGLYELLQTLFSFEFPDDINAAESSRLLEDVATDRIEQLKELERIFLHLEEHGNVEDIAKGRFLKIP